MAAAVVTVARTVRLPEEGTYTGKVVYARTPYALVLYRDRLAFFSAASNQGAPPPTHATPASAGAIALSLCVCLCLPLSVCADASLPLSLSLCACVCAR
jgi:hypothetical protein